MAGEKEIVRKTEQGLCAHIRHRRMAEAGAGLLFLVLTVILALIRENGKTVEWIGDISLVTYPSGFEWGILCGMWCLMVCAVLLTCDLLLSRVSTAYAGDLAITCYMGLVHTAFYADGAQVCRTAWTHYADFSLPDGTTATAAIGKHSVHLSFASGAPSVDF